MSKQTILKQAFTYKGLKEVRKHINASRDLTKTIESNPYATRDEMIKAVGAIGDRQIRAKKFITKNDDWNIIRQFNDYSSRLIEKRRGLDKISSFKFKDSF